MGGAKAIRVASSEMKGATEGKSISVRPATFSVLSSGSFQRSMNILRNYREEMMRKRELGFGFNYTNLFRIGQ